jgi:response regulator RpfG family c-di-GMP phosphodiesterase
MSMLKVLVVDDEMPNLRTFQRVYRKHYEIQLADTGEGGLDLLSQQEFDAVVLDFGMPVMSGAEFIEKAQRVQPVAVVMVTGYMTHPDVLELESSRRIFALLGKPWNRDELIDAVARAGEHTRALRGMTSPPRISAEMGGLAMVR